MTAIDQLFDTTLQQIDSGELREQDYEWEEEPPTFDEYISSGKYIDPVKLSKNQYNSVITVIGNNPKKIFAPERQISLGILCIGKGGGKDWVVAIVMSYIVVVLLHLKNAGRFLGIDDNLDLLNVATKGKQAEDVFFSKFITRIKINKYIKNRYNIYEEGRLVNKIKKPKGVIKLSKKSALFPNNIRCFAETSENEKWEGYNVIFFVLDEISGFTSEKESLNGWKIFETAKTSCISRSNKNFKGLGYVISYPRQEKNDIILQLLEQSRNPENTYWWGLHCFSWQFKPSHQYCGEKFMFRSKRFNRFFGYSDESDVGIEIPIEYKEDFDLRPEDSLTKYCALPPRASGDWIEYPERILSAVDKNQQKLFDIEDYVETVIDENGESFQFLCKRIKECFEKDFSVKTQMHYVAWLDNAEVGCDAVIAIGRKEMVKFIDPAGEEKIDEICRIVDVINWLPEPGISINLINVEDFLINEIKSYINLREVGADSWNTAGLLQKLRRAKITPFKYNLLDKQYKTAKLLFYEGRVRIYDEERAGMDRNRKEMTSLEQILALENTARGPNKKVGFKKDKSDAVVGVLNLLMGGHYTSAKKTPMAQKIGKGKIGTPSNANISEGTSGNPFSGSVGAHPRRVTAIAGLGDKQDANNNSITRLPRPVKI